MFAFLVVVSVVDFCGIFLVDLLRATHVIGLSWSRCHPESAVSATLLFSCVALVDVTGTSFGGETRHQDVAFVLGSRNPCCCSLRA